MIALLFLACAPDEEAPSAEAPCEAVSGTICTFAGNGTAGLGGEEVPARETMLYLPQDIGFGGPEGKAYVLDWNNHRVREIDADGTMRTIAGDGQIGDGPEGPALEARFNHPTNLTFDAQDRLIISAWHNSRIERVDFTTGELDFIAGDGTRSFAGDAGEPAETAKLDLPSSVSYDPDGNLYVSDQANQIIRRIDTSGGIWTIAGTPKTAGYAGDGDLAINAQLHGSVGQAAAPANKIEWHDGILYVADTDNQRVRFIDMETGIIDTFAGNGTAGKDGDGGPATEASLFQPTDIAIGLDGELYIADTSNSCIRVVDPDGVISTFAGRCGEPGFEGDGGAPADATLNMPYGVAVDPAGNVYIADSYNHVVRVVYR
jgi:DNA-binding beta-propeller fold protein YncE